MRKIFSNCVLLKKSEINNKDLVLGLSWFEFENVIMYLESM